jgi:hypothetical protein
MSASHLYRRGERITTVSGLRIIPIHSVADSHSSNDPDPQNPQDRNQDQLEEITVQGQKSTLSQLGSCIAAQYGFGGGDTHPGIDLAKALSEIGSLPVPKRLVGLPVVESAAGGASVFTNVLTTRLT